MNKSGKSWLPKAFVGASRMTAMVIREIRHMNHILMELTQRGLYRVIIGRIERNSVSGGTVWLISYYNWLKKRYRHNYDKAHGLRKVRNEV